MAISTNNIQLPDSWLKYLGTEFDQDYMKGLKSFLKEQINNGKTVYPHGKNIFNALNLTPFEKVKVVIIGQDPYHGQGQAHGLSFSVQKGVKIPPSLKNIYKEIQSDLGFSIPEHGCLESWAEQGVLLLNSVLTVEDSQPGSHRGKGWEQFTDKIVQTLNNDKEHLVFILWGRDAKEKAAQVDRSKHLVLESAHPSPFSATKFFGNKHFSKANEYLVKNGESPINWLVH